MDLAETLDQLRSMCAADSHPVLDEAALAQCLDRARRPDAAGNPPANVTTAAAHATSTQFTAGSVIKVGTRWWRALVTATTAASVPSWPDLDGSPVSATRIADGDQTWADNGAEWTPTWSLRAAAADAWERKAGFAAGDFDFGTGDQTFDRSQVVDHCLRMARRHRGGIASSVEVARC